MFLCFMEESQGKSHQKISIKKTYKQTGVSLTKTIPSPYQGHVKFVRTWSGYGPDMSDVRTIMAKKNASRPKGLKAFLHVYYAKSNFRLNFGIRKIRK